MEAKKTKSKEPKVVTTLDEIATQVEESETSKQYQDMLTEAIIKVSESMDILKSMYALKAENPISSVLITLELVEMNLYKIKSS
jgi:predicted transcriptional regulator